MKHSHLMIRAAFAASIAAFAVVSAKAIDYSPWLVPGGGDLALRANWDADKSPFHGDGTANVADFRPFSPAAPMFFTASVDLSFNGLSIQENSSDYQEYTFDPGAGRTILFNGAQNAAIHIGGSNGQKTLVRFKSGTYGLVAGASGNNKRLRVSSGNGSVTGILESASTVVNLDTQFSPYRGNMICVTNGAVLRGMLRVEGDGQNLHDGMFLVSGSDPIVGTPSTYDAANQRALVFDNNNNGGGFTMLVNDGAVVTNFFGRWGGKGSNAKLVIDNARLFGSESASEDFNVGYATDSGTSSPTNNSVTVRGANGFLAMPGPRSLTIGRNGSGNWVSVEDGARMDANVVNVGNNGSAHRLCVSSGAYLNVFSKLASGAGSFGNEIDIGGAGTRLDVRCDARGSNGNGIEIASSNTVFRIHDGAVVTNRETSAGTRILGNNSSFELLSGSEFFAANGFQQAWDADVYGTTVRIEGSRLVATNKTFQIGPDAGTDGTPRNNTLWVGTGGVLEAHRLRFYGHGNTLVVSNGTVVLTGEFKTSYNRDETCGDTRAVFAGDSPKLRVNGNVCEFLGQCALHFDIPAAGYAEIPIIHDCPNNTRNLYFRDRGMTLTVDAEEYAKLGGGSQTLIKSDKEIHISDDQIADLNANLPEDCSVTLSDDKMEIVLKVPNSFKATVIVFR